MAKKYDGTTPLPKNICDNISKYRAEYRIEMYQDQLFDRRSFLQGHTEDEWDDIGTGGQPDERRKFINRCCDVYMDD